MHGSDVWEGKMEGMRQDQAFEKEEAPPSPPRLQTRRGKQSFMARNIMINESTGHEEVFQVNYLSTAALAMLLLPTLKEKRPKGQPIVSSGLALTASFANQDAEPLIPSFDDPAGWNMSVASDRHSTSKLLDQMFVVKLKDFVAPNNVVVNLVDPGFVRGYGARPERAGLREGHRRRDEASPRTDCEGGGVDVHRRGGSEGEGDARELLV